MNFANIPDVLTTASIDAERPRSLKTMGQLLKISYELLQHPILSNWKHYEAIDPFMDAMENVEYYKVFNRTVIERTISQSIYFSGIELESGVITMQSKGIEYAIFNVDTFFLTANKLFSSTNEELNTFGIAVNLFRLQNTGQLTAAIKYFLQVCNDLIQITLKHHILNNLRKRQQEFDKMEFLLREKANLQQQKDQFDEKVFEGVMKTIQVELDYHKNLHDYIDIPFELGVIVNQFLAEKKALISNQKLLLFLVEDDLDHFTSSLSELVLQLFSYHDVGGSDTEKVYHAFLLGVLNGFKDYYRLISNKESGKGRFDIMLVPNTLEYKGVVIEVKRSISDNKTNIENIQNDALQQIMHHKYYMELKDLGHSKFIAIAAVFYGKELFLKHSQYTIH